MSKLILKPTPAGCLDLIRARLSAMAKRQHGAADLAKLDLGQVQIFASLPVCAAQLDLARVTVQIPVENELGSVALLRHHAQYIAAAFMRHGTDGTPVEVTQLTFGGLVDQIIEALHAAEDLQQDGEYTPRLVSAAQIGLNLLHLVARPGTKQADVFLPIVAHHDSLRGKHYEASALNAMLSARLQSFLTSMSGSPTGIKAWSN